MFTNVRPEKAGICSKKVQEFLQHLDDLSLSTHDVLMCRGNDIFCEAYWKPFDKDFCHRQYSQTKSFVGIAMMLLLEEGKIKLSDKICDYFRDKITRKDLGFLEDQTIEDMLTMRTSVEAPWWFKDTANKDRVDAYFNESKILHPSGTLWQYDSAGSQVLCSLVERLTNMPLLEYLRLKLFNKMGTFKTAEILKTPTGDSFGDSALICTPRDMLSFARLLLNGGTYNGERLIGEEYVKKATSPIVADTINAHEIGLYCGYGYQIWTMKNNCFAFIGMGQQFTFCYPEKDLIFIINSDNQGALTTTTGILDLFYNIIIKNISDEVLSDSDEDYKALSNHVNALELRCLKGIKNDVLKEKINGKKFVAIDKNSQGIEYVKLTFDDNGTGRLNYKNAQGEKELVFGVDKNAFGKFPQYGYSTDIAGIPSTDNSLYDCATSLAFTGENQLSIYVQVIDKYFGNLTIVMGFKGDYVSVYFNKIAENFFNEYVGEFVAKLNG